MDRKMNFDLKAMLPILIASLFMGIILVLIIIKTIFNFSGIIAWFANTFNDADRIITYSLYFFSIITLTLIIRTLLCKKYPELRKSLNFIATVFCLLAITITTVLLTKSGRDYQTSLTVLTSSIVLGTGWWIQSIVSSSSARKSHTINTIMNQRHSAHYFSKLDNVYNTFGLHTTINEEIAKQYYYGYKSGRKVKQELIQACRDAAYILNYYEFISAGLLRNDFDEALIKECFFSPMKMFERRAHFVMEVYRKDDGDSTKVYENFILILDRWLDEKSLTTRKKDNSNTAIPVNAFLDENDIYEMQTPVSLVSDVKKTSDHSAAENPTASTS